MKQENILISVEGNIGSGKSTLVSIMKSQLTHICNRKLIFLDEPVDIWENIRDKTNKSILEKFYEDQEKYGFSFQIMAYISRLMILKEALKRHNNSIIITERCLYTDKNVFASLLYEDDKIEEINYKIYLMWFDYFVSDIPTFKFIYLKTSPEICFERVIKRSRVGEIIPIDYLKKLTEKHDNWLINYETLILNGNTEKTTEQEYRPFIEKIIQFIHNIIDKKHIIEFEETIYKSCY